MVVASRRWRVPAQPQEVGGLRREVAAYAAECGMDPAGVANVRLAVSEAVTNSVLHAYLNGPPGRITVEAASGDARFDVVVCDEGSGMRPRLDSPGAGLGLGLMASATETLRTRDLPDGGLEVAMCFSLA